jgi:hypothetical protein
MEAGRVKRQTDCEAGGLQLDFDHNGHRRRDIFPIRAAAELSHEEVRFF